MDSGKSSPICEAKSEAQWKDEILQGETTGVEQGSIEPECGSSHLSQCAVYIALSPITDGLQQQGECCDGRRVHVANRFALDLSFTSHLQPTADTQSRLDVFVAASTRSSRSCPLPHQASSATPMASRKTVAGLLQL